jgi:hypothetical protein
VVRQLVLVEDRVTSKRGHLEQLPPVVTDGSFPYTRRRGSRQKGGKRSPVEVRFPRNFPVRALTFYQFEVPGIVRGNRMSSTTPTLEVCWARCVNERLQHTSQAA